MRSRYEDKAKVASEQPERAVPLRNEVIASHQRLHRDIIQAERGTVIRLRDQEQIDDDVLREIECELDLEDQRFRGEEANESLP